MHLHIYYCTAHALKELYLWFYAQKNIRSVTFININYTLHNNMLIYGFKQRNKELLSIKSIFFVNKLLGIRFYSPKIEDQYIFKRDKNRSFT